MKTLIKCIILCWMIFSFMGCSSEEIKTVEWYMAPENKEALHEKIAQCRNNPGKLSQTPNCINAQEAADKIVLGRKLHRGQVLPPATF